MTEYIDKNATVGILEAMSRNADCECIKKWIGKAAKRVSAIPAADVAPVVHGRWERDAYSDWYCTNCDEVVAICESGRERTYRKPYRPNCGAKMDIENGGDGDEAD